MTGPNDPQIEDWLALHLVPGIGNISFRNLLDRFGSPAQVFKAGLKELTEIDGLRKVVAQRIYDKGWTIDPPRVLETLKSLDARVITYWDPEYPRLLKEVHDPPMLLYIKGIEIPANMAFIAIVGSRNPTPYGKKEAEKIGQGLGRRGLGVASGMAMGIDAASHWGCLGGLGYTVAVLGTGIDVIYPTSNKRLYHQIAEKGAVITEFPLGTPPEPKHFPIRNRIISGLSRGVVVVEATLNSGSLITASLALDQGREVFAVPGSINSFKSKGCHFLIKQGATLIENADDVLDELGMNYATVPKTDTFKQNALPLLGENEKAIFDLIGDYPIHIDQIANQGNLEPREVSSILMKMELKGIVRQLPGKLFVR